MFFRFSVAALAALCLSAPALTQQAIAQQPTVHDKSQDARIDELAKQLAALTTRLGMTENKVADIDRRIESLTTNVEKLTQVTADVDSRLKSLSDKVNELSDKPSTELTAMKTQLDAISVKDGDTYVPNISAAMTGSNKFRQDMETAVNKSLKTGGTVLLTNKTAVAQWVEINRTRYFLRPSEQLPVAVNIGTVTTELPGEEMQTWTITAPAYQLALEIVPRPELSTPVAQAAGYLEMASAAHHIRLKIAADLRAARPPLGRDAAGAGAQHQGDRQPARLAGIAALHLHLQLRRVHPVILGAGTPYFPKLERPIGLRLTETRRFESGAMYLGYAAR